MGQSRPEDASQASGMGRRRGRADISIAILALAVAVGHVVYAFIGDHVVD